ncbi:fas domain protein [Mycobacterium xenopi 4042]|uniref:Fas domain protein n=1 Tax=Mycobacterium xenopi 4042 TaxID=1299334 RepID=X8E5R5_MYCXE|nr:fas domain protein [Mycobacterium xenopi 4042]
MGREDRRRRRAGPEMTEAILVRQVDWVDEIVGVHEAGRAGFSTWVRATS